MLIIFEVKIKRMCAEGKCYKKDILARFIPSFARRESLRFPQFGLLPSLAHLPAARNIKKNKVKNYRSIKHKKIK